MSEQKLSMLPPNTGLETKAALKQLARANYIENGLSITRKTAVNYLSSLEKEGFLTSEKIGKERIYQNKRLYDLVEYGQLLFSGDGL